MNELLHFQPQEAAIFQTDGSLALKAEYVPPPFNLVNGSNVIFAEDRFKKRQSESKKLSTEATLVEHIEYFDSNWRAEKLPQDWYELRRNISFSVASEMRNLKSTDQTDVESWARQAKFNLIGYYLECLSDHVVYPRKYVPTDDRNSLVDPQYGKDIEEIVSPDERNGSVKEAVGKIKQFFLEGFSQEEGEEDEEKLPDGTLAFYASPLGPTGLFTDNGESITYSDSYFFVLEKQGGSIMNYTFQTDFALSECQKIMQRICGIRLEQDTPLEAYTQAMTTIKPGERDDIHGVFDIVAILQNVRRQENPARAGYAYENIRWESVYEDVRQGPALYEIDTKAKAMICEFEGYCKSQKRTRLELKKALSATFLRVSHFFLAKAPSPTRVSLEATHSDFKLTEKSMSFGDALEEAGNRPGCQGGTKKKKTVTSLGDRLGEVSFGDKKILCCTCPFCGQQVEAIIAGGQIMCPECGASADYQDDSGSTASEESSDNQEREVIQFEERKKEKGDEAKKAA